MKLCALVLALLALCCASACMGDRLSMMASTDAAMRASAKAAHAHRFVHNLQQYAAQLADSADLVLLQAESLAKHRAGMRAMAEAEAEAEMEAEAESEAEADAHSDSHFGADEALDPIDAMVAATAAQEDGLARQMESAFAAGDALGVVTVMEQANAMRLLPKQRAQLAQKVETAMKQVSGELRQSGQPLDRVALRARLEGLLSEVTDPEPEPAHPDGKMREVGVKPMTQAEIDKLSSSDTPDWIAEALVHATEAVERKDSTLYKAMVSNARDFELENDPEVRQHMADVPLEELMAADLQKALDSAKDSKSSFFKEMVAGVANYSLTHDPALKPLNDAIEHPDGKLFKQLVKEVKEVERVRNTPPPSLEEQVVGDLMAKVDDPNSGFFNDLVVRAANHSLHTDPDILQHAADVPLETIMERHLQDALRAMEDKKSPMYRELTAKVAAHLVNHDPELQQDPQWIQDMLATSIHGLKDPSSPIHRQLVNQVMQRELKTNPDLQQAPDWIEGVLAGAVKDLDAGRGEITQVLDQAAEASALLHPEAPSLDTLAASILGHIDERELEAQIRYSARREMLDDMVEVNKQKCLRKRKRGEKCDLNEFVKSATEGIQEILESKVPVQLEDHRDASLPASGSLAIARSKTATPEAVRDVEASIKGGVDPWFDLPGRSTKAMRVKSKTVADLLDADGHRCPGRCSLRGQCVMDLNTTMKSPSGSQNVHPFVCLCDAGYVGESCQIKLDMHLRWLLTEGAAPFPKCCNVCAKQRNAPETFDDIPGYHNPFSAIEPKCLPFPRVSLYSREDGSHEMVKGRRPNPQCSYPLGEITRADPMIALELAADLGNAQQVLQSQLLTDMAAMAQNAEHASQMSDAAASLHVARLHAASARLHQASASARKAAQKLAEKLHLPTLDGVKASSIDMAQVMADYREMPNDMEECCLFCDMDKQADPLIANQDPAAANAGANSLLNKDPRFDNAVDAVHRRMAKQRQERRHAKLLGVEAPGDADCCVVCPYNFREVERLTEAAHVRAHSAAGGDDLKKEMSRVFLETFAQVDRARRRRHEPFPCCPACPSQFLIAHAFPAGPFNTARTMPNQGPN